MKPQIVESGFHNADLAASTTRTKTQEQQRQWYLRNAEKKKRYAKERYAANRAAIIEKAKEYRISKPHVTLASRLKCEYGISIQAYEAMLSDQNHCCAICSLKLDSESKASTPHVDHCHKTGRVRGILCSKCNASLGHIEKDGFLDAALSYLEKK